MRMPLWTLALPIVSIALVGMAIAWPPGTALALLCAAALIGSVLASVHHAEVVAHRVGEPFGTLVLAVAVTVIEAALIVSMMLAGGADKSALPRDTIFSAIMIICNGAVGLCLLAGGLKHHEQTFRLEGAASALATLIALSTLTLVLPAFTTTAPGPRYTTTQLTFAAIASLVLWAVFVFVQTVRHRDYFLPPDNAADESAHAPPPSVRLAWASFGLLVVSLLAVIGLAKSLSPTIERGVEAAGLPAAVIGIVIALLVLLPETWAALRAARADRLQTSLNLALGSALASIGLTIPVLALLSVVLGLPLLLGLSPKDLVLLALTFVVSGITLGTGRTNRPARRRSPRDLRRLCSSRHRSVMALPATNGLRGARVVGLVAAIGWLAACSSPLPLPNGAAHVATATSAPAAARAVAAASGPSAGSARTSLEQPHARWRAAAWSELPGWGLDRSAEAWTAFLRSCERPAASWAAVCAAAQRDAIDLLVDDVAVRTWLEAHLQPWRVESLDGQATGLATGYFEPLVEASRSPRPGFRVALYAPPPDLATRRPYWTRHQLDTLPAARQSLHGSEIAWLRDPLDALLLQVQGSGRLIFVDERGRPQALVRVAFAAHNDQPYRSVGRWLVEHGEVALEQASWPSIRAWARQNPKRVDEMLWSNPRVVFFREEPLPDPSVGPKGAQGVPLTPGRSIAVDPLSIPYGTPVWMDTTEPLSATPLRRLVVAQDTGSAITGAVRTDYFWGWGESAENQAGRMKQPLRMWVLWPR